MKVQLTSTAMLRNAGAALFMIGVTSWTWAQGPVREVYQQIDLGNNRTQLRMEPWRVQNAFDSLFILSDSVYLKLSEGIISPRGLAVDSSITLVGGSGGAWNTVALGPNSSATAFGAKALGSESTASWVDAMAAGRGSTADKWAAVALGAGSAATAADALALGRLSTASGYGATALGANSSSSAAAAFASGTSATASNWATIAMGANSTASGSSAIALGVRSTSSGWNSMAFGADSKATASHAFAAGQLSTASGSHSWAFGDSTIASGHHAMAFGFRAKSYGEHAHAMGYKSLASGSHSNAWGYESVASGAHGYALGWRSQATGWSSLALGQNAIASGAYALALGDSTVASGYNSLALGSYARSTGHNTVAAANNSEARSYYEVQFGTFVDVASLGTADPDTYVPEEALFVIGNGTSDGARSNALVIRKDGAASFSDSLHVDENVDIDGNLNIDGRLDGDSATFTGVVNVGDKVVTDSIWSAVGGHLNLRSALDVNVDAADDISLDAVDDLNLEGRDIFIDVNEEFELRMDGDEDYIRMDDTGGGSEYLWLQDEGIGSGDNLMTIYGDDGIRIAVGASSTAVGIEMNDNSDIMIQYADSMYQPIQNAYFLHLDPSESNSPHPVMTGQEHIYLTDDLNGNWSMMQHMETGDERDGNGNFLGIYGTEDISISAGYDAGLEFSQYFDAAVLYGDSIVMKGETFVTDDLHVTGALTVNGQAITPGGGGLAFNILTMDVASGPPSIPQDLTPVPSGIFDPESNFAPFGGTGVVITQGGFYEINVTTEISYSGISAPGHGGKIYMTINGAPNSACAASGTPSEAFGRSGFLNFTCKIPLTPGDILELNGEDYGTGAWAGLQIDGGTVTMSRLN